MLVSMGLHRIGLWKSECSCGSSIASSKSSWMIDTWDLPTPLCPCCEPTSPVSTCLSSWEDYYHWRCLPFHSPAALLLHWPLTIYHCFQVSGIQSSISANTDILRIHYLGPEKEILQLGVFGELVALFPGVQLQLDFVGPAVPHLRILFPIWLLLLMLVWLLILAGYQLLSYWRTRGSQQYLPTSVKKQPSSLPAV